ncbi:hypothetical protein MMC25_008137 [Agyrium rufum]|nr:hypothetical protein [Agyrium rufum]
MPIRRVQTMYAQISEDLNGIGYQTTYMMLLNNHLEQIQLSAQAVTELPFPAPKIFTNALLYSSDITALIRDTEPHERALFSSGNTNARVFDNGRGEHATYGHLPSDVPIKNNTQRNTALRSLVGSDVLHRIRQENEKQSRERGDIDMNCLPIEGASRRIEEFRNRFESLSASIASYSNRIAEQTAQLEQIHQDTSFAGREGHQVPSSSAIDIDTYHDEENVEVDEAQIKTLENRRRTLEDRVSGMERDLGGLMR